MRLIVEQPVHTLVTNIQGTETVLEYCNRFGRRVLVASTSEVYGDHREEKPLEENARRVYGPTTEKRWLYADSKAIDEFLALAYHLERGLDCVIVRLFNTVGPRQSGQYGMVIPRFVQSALAGAALEIHGDGTQTRSFCHVEDTARALKDLMDDRSINGEIFNVGSTDRITILELAERIKQLTGSDSENVFVPYDQVYGQGIEDTLHREPAIDKIGAAIGWAPTRSLEDILQDVIEHARRAPVLPDRARARHGSLAQPSQQRGRPEPEAGRRVVPIHREPREREAVAASPARIHRERRVVAGAARRAPHPVVLLAVRVREVSARRAELVLDLALRRLQLTI